MNCSEFRTCYSDFADGLLEEAAEVAVQVHLAECRPCRRFHETLLRGLSTLRDGPAVRASGGFEERLLNRLDQESSPFAPVLRQWSAMAAATLVLTVIGLFVWDVAEQGGRAAPVARRGPVPYLSAASPAESVTAPAWFTDDSGFAPGNPFRPIPADDNAFSRFGVPPRAWQASAVWVGR